MHWSSRSAIIALTTLKTPNHHTKAKWRPFRREKVLDVSSTTCTNRRFRRRSRAVFCRSIYPISTRDRRLRTSTLQEQTGAFQAWRNSANSRCRIQADLHRCVQWVAPYDDLLRSNIDLCCSGNHSKRTFLPKGDGKATLMSRDVSELDNLIDLSILLIMLSSVWINSIHLWRRTSLPDGIRVLFASMNPISNRYSSPDIAQTTLYRCSSSVDGVRLSNVSIILKNARLLFSSRDEERLIQLVTPGSFSVKSDRSMSLLSKLFLQGNGAWPSLQNLTLEMVGRDRTFLCRRHQEWRDSQRYDHGSSDNPYAFETGQILTSLQLLHRLAHV